MKIRPVRAELFHADTLTDLIVALRNAGNLRKVVLAVAGTKQRQSHGSARGLLQYSFTSPVAAQCCRNMQGPGMAGEFYDP